MILETYTKDELIKTMQEVHDILDQRAYNYMVRNAKSIYKKALGKEYKRLFSGIIKNQRYYYNAIYSGKDGSLKRGHAGIFTFAEIDQHTLAITFNPTADPNSDNGSYLQVITLHFLNRYCERTNINKSDLTLPEKLEYFRGGKDPTFWSTKSGDIMKKYEKTKLRARFLDTTNFDIFFASNYKGDLAVVEMYGTIPVWRTFISEDMLRDNQTSNPYYKIIKQKAKDELL